MKPPPHPLLTLTLLLASLLSAPFLAFGAEPEMVAALQAAGFKPQVKEGVVTDFGWGNPAFTPELWQRLPELTSLRSLIAEGKCTDTAGLEVLTKLPNLEKLFINGSTFDDAGFAVLARVPNLKSIGFDHNHVFTGAGMGALKAAPNLRRIGLGGCMKVTAEGAKSCGEVTQLESLKLTHLGLGDDTLAAFDRLVNLRELEFDNSFRGTLTGAGLAKIGAMKGLEKLMLGEFVTTYDSGLKHLTGLRGLKTLTLAKVGLPEQDLARLQAALPETKITHTPPADQELGSWQRNVAKLNAGPR
jgi:hypothetical protein